MTKVRNPAKVYPQCPPLEVDLDTSARVYAALTFQVQSWTQLADRWDDRSMTSVLTSLQARATRAQNDAQRLGAYLAADPDHLPLGMAVVARLTLRDLAGAWESFAARADRKRENRAAAAVYARRAAAASEVATELQALIRAHFTSCDRHQVQDHGVAAGGAR